MITTPTFDWSHLTSGDTISLSSLSQSNTVLSSQTMSVSAGTVTGAAYPNAITVNSGTSISNPWAPTHASPKIQLNGEGADIEVNGKSVVALLERIEQRLNILTPNTELESEWDELRELGDQYRKLEEHIQAKMKTWEVLKKMPPPEIY